MHAKDEQSYQIKTGPNILKYIYFTRTTPTPSD